jgi:hypothetical protein
LLQVALLVPDSRHNIKKCSDRLQYYEKETQKQTLGGAFQEASEIQNGG